MAKKATDSQIKESYAKHRNIWKVASELGMCGQSVQERLVKLGIDRSHRYFTNDELAFLRENYTNYLLKGKLQELADKMDRTKSSICRIAKQMGLTNMSRKKSLLANFQPHKPDWSSRPHPKGMKGKKHSPGTIELLCKINKENQKKINADPDKRADITKRTLQTKHEKGVFANQRPQATWKAGWREIGDRRKYFRSRWEANYARYLEFLKVHGEIKEWDHECEVFWFDGIKRGCISYLPDFKVTNKDDSSFFVEVKGWMDDRSKTKINRMRIYHPQIVLKIISGDWFKSNNRKLSKIIKGWE